MNQNGIEIRIVDFPQRKKLDPSILKYNQAIADKYHFEGIYPSYWIQTGFPYLRINKEAGINPVQLDPEVYSLIEPCLKVSAITQGAFDITTKPLKTLYNFRNGTFNFPSEKDRYLMK